MTTQIYEYFLNVRIILDDEGHKKNGQGLMGVTLELASVHQ